MIGYEILTRQPVYSGVNLDIAVSLIISNGQKPNEQNLNDVEKALLENSGDSEIFAKLNELIKRCWQFKPEDRPKISNVKKVLNELALHVQLYDGAINEEANYLVRSIAMMHNQQVKRQPNKIANASKSIAYECILWLVIVGMFSVIAAVSIAIFQNVEFPDVHGSFLAIDSKSLYKYNVRSKKISFLSNYRNKDEIS